MGISGPGELAAGPLAAFAAGFRDWLADQASRLAPLLAPVADFDERVRRSRDLRAALCENGWGLVGWPAEAGGLGGDLRHRAVVHEELFAAGWTGPTVFEHLEIVAPTLVRHADPDFVKSVLPAFLDGSQAWSQGFSEPEAGSDLAALRTRAEFTGAAFVITGAKIWTSWSKYADWCLVLARTGSARARHRGLTMIAVDLNSPGVAVRPLTQANGTDELAEVAFQEVVAPAGQVVGEVDGGWAVAMYLLARERGTLSWLKQGGLRQRLAASAVRMGPEHDRELGDVVLQVAGVRAAAAQLLTRAAAGEALGAEAAFNKLLMTRTEQNLYNLVRSADGVRTALPGEDTEEVLLQQDYLFSRIVTIYGGSQQMQLSTVARHVLGLAGD